MFYRKITDKKIKEREKIEAQKNLLILRKQYRLQTACEKAEYQPPCNGTQVSGFTLVNYLIQVDSHRSGYW